MNLSIQTPSYQNTEENASAVHAVTHGKKTRAATENRKNVFFGDTLLASKDPIEVRRKLAQKKAMKVVQDAYANDGAVDQQISDRQAHYNEMSGIRENANNELKDLNHQQQALQKEYGVAEDSEEQQDLELLKKEQDVQNHVSEQSLSSDEMERLAEIHKKPLTEYQSRALGLNGFAVKAKLDMQEAQRQMNDDTADIKSIRLERLKSSPMLEAQQSAEDILEAASKEIQGMLVEEAKSNIDEKAEELKEEAKEKAKEKKEKDEIIEERQEQQALEQALIEGTKEAVEEAKAKQQRNDAPEIEADEMMRLANPADAAKSVGESLEEIKNSMKLLEADLKGISVDEEV